MAEQAPPAPERVGLELDFLAAAAAIAGLAIGSFGPWATALGLVSASGLDGDGWISLLCAVFAAGALYQCWRGINRSNALVVLGAIGGGVAGYHWNDISSQGGALTSPGWGVVLATLAGGALFLSGLSLQRRKAFAPAPGARSSARYEPFIPRDGSASWTLFLRRLIDGPGPGTAPSSARVEAAATDRAQVREGPVEPGSLEK